MENVQMKTVQPVQNGPAVKKRNVVLCILFSIITVGIYGIYWYVCLTNDTNKLSKYKTAGGVAAIFFTIITVGIYGFYWYFMLGKKVGDFDGGSSNGVLYLILSLFGLGFISQILAQGALNRVAEPQQNKSKR